MTDKASPNTPTPPRDLDPIRWGQIFGLLSTDVIKPYVAPMGLVLPKDGAFPTGLREIIRRFRALAEQDPSAPMPFAATVFEMAEKRYGGPFGDHLYTWGTDTFQDGSGGAHVFLWNNIVRRGGLDGARDKGPVPATIKRLRRVLATSFDPSRVAMLPVTDWDTEIYRRAGYEGEDDPQGFVRLTIRHHAFVTAWDEVFGDSPDASLLDEVKTWGMGEARALNMPLDIVKPPGNFGKPPPRWHERS